MGATSPSSSSGVRGAYSSSDTGSLVACLAPIPSGTAGKKRRAALVTAKHFCRQVFICSFFWVWDSGSSDRRNSAAARSACPLGQFSYQPKQSPTDTVRNTSRDSRFLDTPSSSVCVPNFSRARSFHRAPVINDSCSGFDELAKLQPGHGFHGPDGALSRTRGTNYC